MHTVQEQTAELFACNVAMQTQLSVETNVYMAKSKFWAWSETRLTMEANAFMSGDECCKN